MKKTDARVSLRQSEKNADRSTVSAVAANCVKWWRTQRGSPSTFDGADRPRALTFAACRSPACVRAADTTVAKRIIDELPSGTSLSPPSREHSPRFVAYRLIQTDAHVHTTWRRCDEKWEFDGTPGQQIPFEQPS